MCYRDLGNFDFKASIIFTAERSSRISFSEGRKQERDLFSWHRYN
jgi:hypothetical protein